MPGANVRTAAGATKFIVPALVILAIVFAGVYVLLGQASTGAKGSSTLSSATSSSPATSQYTGPLPSTTVRTAVNQWFTYFNSRNVEGLMNFYGFSSDVIWTGNTEGLQGGYAGDNSIRILYGATIGKTTQLIATLSNYTETPLSPVNTNVTMTIRMAGNSSVLGSLNGTIVATQDWFYTSGQWQIVKENWDYKTFAVQYPQSATTFPQWNIMREGKSPDLVAEKSLEWHAGPFVAAAVYALLASAVLLALLTRRSHRK